MRFLTLTATIFCCLSTWSMAAEGGQQLSSQKDKESYSIGYQVGLSINTDAVEVDMARLIQGLQDGVSKKDPLLNYEEMKNLVLALKEKARVVALKRVQELRVKNAEESKNFLMGNAQKEGVQVTPSGLQYKIIKEGKGESPRKKDFVKVHYRGTFVDGKEFDSSFIRGEPQTFQTDGVIKGWTEALLKMRVGSKWQLFVPPDLAYGRGGLGQKIPPNKVLVFEMELMEIEPNA